MLTRINDFKVKHYNTISNRCSYCDRFINFSSSRTRPGRNLKHSMRIANNCIPKTFSNGQLGPVAQRGTWDHFFPKSELKKEKTFNSFGSNLVECCERCNVDKGSKLFLIWLLEKN